MLGGERHIASAEQGVGAGGEHGDGVPRDVKINLGALRAADPVALHRLDFVGPIQQVKVIDQAIRVGGDAHHPLGQLLAEDGEVAALGLAVCGDLLISQHRSQAGAPVDHRITAVDQAEGVHDLCLSSAIQGGVVLVASDLAALEALDQLRDRLSLLLVLIKVSVEDLQEDPLRPLVELHIGGGDATATVVAQAQAAELPLHIVNRLLGFDPRVGAGLDRVLLRWQAESVVPEGVEDIFAKHAVVAGVDVGGDVAQRVADVETSAGGEGEHVLNEKLRLVRSPRVGWVFDGEVTHGVGCVEGAVIDPVVLPDRFDLASQFGGIAMLGSHKQTV